MLLSQGEFLVAIIYCLHFVMRLFSISLIVSYFVLFGVACFPFHMPPAAASRHDIEYVDFTKHFKFLNSGSHYKYVQL